MRLRDSFLNRPVYVELSFDDNSDSTGLGFTVNEETQTKLLALAPAN